MTDKRTRALAELEVVSAEGKRFALGSLWTSRPVLLVMVRHFG